MRLTGERVLVAGADGFTGSHLTEDLVGVGAKVRAFVYYNSFNSWGWLDEGDARAKQSIEVFSGDIRDPHGVPSAPGMFPPSRFTRSVAARKGSASPRAARHCCELT